MFLSNTPAKAKLTFNKKLKVYKLVVAFNVHKRLVKNKWGEEVYKFAFPVQKQCAYVSGDINAEALSEELTKLLPRVQEVLRTDNITIVE
jgi:hypothetical protein